MTERNADVSKTLTKQFKKGALLCGWYWCKCYNEETKLLYYDGDSFELDDPETKNYYFFLPKDIAEITILAPVLSYEEYQQLLSDQLAKNEGVEINAELESENTKLKELLKEIRGKLHYINTPVNQHNIFSNDFIKRLDQVLGEE